MTLKEKKLRSIPAYLNEKLLTQNMAGGNGSFDIKDTFDQLIGMGHLFSSK